MKKHIYTFFILFLLSTLFYFKTNIGVYLGYNFFGGSILGIKVYDTRLSEFFYKVSLDEDKPARFIYYQLSRLSFIKGDLRKSVAYADKELFHYADNCRTHYIRGLAFAYQDKLDEAISDFKIFNNCFPLTWAGHNDLAWFYFRRGDFSGARDVLEKVIDIYPDNIWLLNSYGTVLLNIGEKTKAREYLIKAQEVVSHMTEKEWGAAYPGNDPRVYGLGLNSLKESIKKNLDLTY